MWDKSKDFITRAFTVIFVATIIVWFLQSFSPQLDGRQGPHDEHPRAHRGLDRPGVRTAGFRRLALRDGAHRGLHGQGDGGLDAVGAVWLHGALLAALTPLSVVSLLVFCLLYTPCVAAIAAIRHELGGRWALGIVAFQCGIAYLVALLVHVVGALLGFA